MDDGRPTRTGQKDPSSNSTESTERQAQLLLELDLIPTADLRGRKLKEIQYKVTKIKTAHYTTTSKDPHKEVVATFQDVKEAKKSRSVLRLTPNN